MVSLGRSVTILGLVLSVSSVLDAGAKDASPYAEVLATINLEAPAGWLGDGLGETPAATSTAGIVDTAAHLRALLQDQLDAVDAYSYDFSSGAPSPVPTTTETCPEGTFRYELALYDYGSNGWDGGTYRLEQ